MYYFLISRVARRQNVCIRAHPRARTPTTNWRGTAIKWFQALLSINDADLLIVHEIVMIMKSTDPLKPLINNLFV